jgi:hypothetical protein
MSLAIHLSRFGVREKGVVAELATTLGTPKNEKR